MPDYKTYGRSNGPQKRPFGAAQGAYKKELYDAQCNSCHERCQVPFRPNGKKPVYCPKCFTKGEGQGVSRPDAGRREYAPRMERSAPASAPDRQIQELNAQLKVLNGTLETFVASIETLTRALALSEEMRKYVPAEEAPAAKKAPVKKAVKKAAPKKASTK